MKMRTIAAFIIIVLISMLLAGCFLSLFFKNKSYPDVAVGEKFSSFGFDGYCRKLPNDYMIEIVYGEGNTVYKISSYDSVMLDAIKIVENVEYYFCIENIVFLQSVEKDGTTTFFSLDTAGIVRENLTLHADESQLLDEYKLDAIDWERASRP